MVPWKSRSYNFFHKICTDSARCCWAAKVHSVWAVWTFCATTSKPRCIPKDAWGLLSTCRLGIVSYHQIKIFYCYCLLNRLNHGQIQLSILVIFLLVTVGICVWNLWNLHLSFTYFSYKSLWKMCFAFVKLCAYTPEKGQIRFSVCRLKSPPSQKWPEANRWVNDGWTFCTEVRACHSDAPWPSLATSAWTDRV